MIYPVTTTSTSYDIYGHSNYHATMISIVTASITLLWSLSLQHLIHNYVFIVTATNTSLWSLIKQLSCPYDPYCYSHYHVSTIYTVTATIMSLCSILYCYSNYYVTMIYTITATITSLRPIPLQQLSCPYKLYCYSTYYVLWAITLQQLSRPYNLYCYSNY